MRYHRMLREKPVRLKLDAPYENPSVAFACSAPTSAENTQNLKSNICVYNVMPEVLQTYFELYPQDQ